jgi:hypothetical protein
MANDAVLRWLPSAAQDQAEDLSTLRLDSWG